jgi:hypothetical protein
VLQFAEACGDLHHLDGSWCLGAVPAAASAALQQHHLLCLHTKPRHLQGQHNLHNLHTPLHTTPPQGGTDVGDHPPITPMRAASEDELGGGDTWRLYDYVARHFLASVSPDAVYRKTKAVLTAGGETFSATGSTTVKPGWLAIMPWKVGGGLRWGDGLLPALLSGVLPAKPVVWGALCQPGVCSAVRPCRTLLLAPWESIQLLHQLHHLSLSAARSLTATLHPAPLLPQATQSTPLPPLKEGEQLDMSSVELHQGRTSPPDYLTESELITLMEKHGIGTDASISTHINNICERNYVRIESGRRVVPTELGSSLIKGYQLIDPELCKPQVGSDGLLLGGWGWSCRWGWLRLLLGLGLLGLGLLRGLPTCMLLLLLGRTADGTLRPTAVLLYCPRCVPTWRGRSCWWPRGRRTRVPWWPTPWSSSRPSLPSLWPRSRAWTACLRPTSARCRPRASR